MLDDERKFTQKDWVLLKKGNSLNTYVGNYIGKLCGMEWNMHAEFVNVILNGDWKGCYYLAPAVCYEAANGLIDDDGYLFENDAYWWKPDMVYFKLNNQIYGMGYTFKYPEITDKKDERLISLKDYMQEFEDLVLAGDDRYTDYIDVESFAYFLLVKDIVGEKDAGGSNNYLYKKNSISKVKAGPLWDFDSSFRTENEWSAIHILDVFYYPQMMSSKVFYNTCTGEWEDVSPIMSSNVFYTDYADKWAEVSPTLLENVIKLLEELDSTQGKAITESWQLDNKRWGYDNDFEEQKQNMIDWFETRIPWMNENIMNEQK